MFARRTLISAIVCALLACAVSVAPAAASQPDPQAQYYASYNKHDAVGSLNHSRFQAAPQARYYASYGQPQSLTPPHQPVPSDNDTWLEIALIAAAALAVAAIGGTIAVRQRRRVPRVAA